MATVSKGRTFTSGETVTPAKLNELVDNATVTSIQTADISDAQITTAKIADANITLAKLVAAVQQSLCPVGTVIASAANSVPTGWLWCDGSEKAIATYPALHAAIGTTYGALTNGSGGAGSTHFRVPDLRARVVRGWDGGVLTAGFGQYQADALQNITGSVLNVWGTSVSGTGAFSVTSGTVSSEPGTGGNGTSSISFSAASSTAEGGARTASETRPKNVAMLFLIKT